MARRERLLRIIRIHAGDPLLCNEAKVHILVAGQLPELAHIEFFFPRYIFTSDGQLLLGDYGSHYGRRGFKSTAQLFERSKTFGQSR